MHNLKIKGGFLLKLRKNILFSYFEIEKLLRKERYFMSKLYECYLDLKANETNSLSVKEAYDFIDIIKNSANLIIGKDNSNAK